MRYWKRVDAQGKTTTVESYSHDLVIKGAAEIDEGGFNDYIASLPVVLPLPTRDLSTEIDDLKTRVGTLEKK
ncbi:MAG: hypothetical protein KKF27_20300 [Gammaproteobacteria bacterium]|nr:hypothetical protein [Gammaproteobacteria bacterium]